jgi:hypothetical protein
MSGINSYLWGILHHMNWWWWGLNTIAALASLLVMAMLAAPVTRLGRFLRWTATVAYWAVILSPLSNVAQPLAMPVLMFSWLGILWQQSQACRASMPEKVAQRPLVRCLHMLSR